MPIEVRTCTVSFQVSITDDRDLFSFESMMNHAMITLNFRGIFFFWGGGDIKTQHMIFLYLIIVYSCNILDSFYR